MISGLACQNSEAEAQHWFWCYMSNELHVYCLSQSSDQDLYAGIMQLYPKINLIARLDSPVFFPVAVCQYHIQSPAWNLVIHHLQSSWSRRLKFWESSFRISNFLLWDRDSLTNLWTHGVLLFPLIMKFGHHGQYVFDVGSIISLPQAFFFFAALNFIR